MSKEISRRQFLENIGVGTAASTSLLLLKDVASARLETNLLPSRTLGRTGAKVSILAFGCGSRFLVYKDEESALAILNHAIDLGVTYLDTAYAYGDGESETRVGKVMASRRKEVWLATKIPDRTRDEFLRRLEASLKRLRTDHVDLVHIHSLGQDSDLAKIEAPNGALKGLMEAREQKMARFVGMTSHTNGEVMARAIERHDLDCVQMALNASRNGRFEELALPAANRKNLGVIAMKVTGQEFLVGDGPGKADMGSLLRYSLSLPVTTAVVGMPRPEMFAQNIETARNFRPIKDQEKEYLRQHLKPARDGLEKRLVGHLDGPTANPGMFLA
ncbi:MAG: aldo/keto reductase [Acidobacteria bacterium]|nr:MAG: aldo/keto reductase [Acidobacteriota bacterium]PYY05983.1 MAG: aldo/keto reductase [Acidobacteriota bacterium]